MSKILVDIVTPERKVFEGDADMVVARGVDGELGVLPGHIPLVTPLKVGVLRLLQGNDEQKVAVSGGFLEVRPDKVTILAETAELKEDIDVARAQEKKKLAEKKLAELSKDSVEYKVYSDALERAENRLKIAQGK